MLKTLLSTLQAVFGAACLVAAYGCITNLVVAAPVPDLLELPPELENPAPRIAWNRSPEAYAVIAKRNLFRRGPEEIAAPTAAEVQTLAETRLPLRLLGTVVSSIPAHSIAAVEDSRARETHVVHEGEQIGSARIEKIERERIVVSNRGRRELLIFESDEESGGKKPLSRQSRSAPDAAARAAASARAAIDRNGRRAPRATRTPGRSGRSRTTDADSAEPEVALAEGTPEEALRDLSTQARFLPQFAEEGGLSGIVVTDIQSNSKLQKIGLQNGDVILSVSGIPINGSQDVVQTLQGLSLANGVLLEIQRGGQPSTIDVPPGTL